MVDSGGLVSTANVTVTITGGPDNLPAVLLGTGNDSRSGVAGEAEDLLYGQNGSDSLSGLGGADTLYAGNGADTLDGGSGIDWLYGERGDDRITTGLGADVVVLSVSGGADTVLDFLVGTDHLHLNGITASSAILVDVDNDGGTNDLAIQLSNGSVTLLNTGAVANWQTQLFV